MKVDKEKLYELYINWANEVSEECDWKTTFGPQEIVYSIGLIIETNPDIIINEE